MLQVWDLAAPGFVGALQPRHPSAIIALAVDGDVCASACGREVRAWDWRTGSLLATFRPGAWVWHIGYCMHYRHSLSAFNAEPPFQILVPISL